MQVSRRSSKDGIGAAAHLQRLRTPAPYARIPGPPNSSHLHYAWPDTMREESERSRTARELHDETGSALTAVLLGLAAIDGAATLSEARQAAVTLRHYASSALENVGRLAFRLRPPALDEFALAATQKDLSSGLEDRGGPKVNLEIDLPAGTRLPSKLEDGDLPDHAGGVGERRQARRRENRAHSLHLARAVRHALRRGRRTRLLQ